jgi:hypothetical protein
MESWEQFGSCNDIININLCNETRRCLIADKVVVLNSGEEEGTISMSNYSKRRLRDLLPSVQNVLKNFMSVISKGIVDKVL